MSVKIERLQQVILEKVARVAQRDLFDPRIGLLTFTRVKLSNDVAHATIYWSILGEDSARGKAERALTDCRGFVQREIAGALRTRVTPHIEFEFDESIAGSVRIAQLLKEALPEGTANPTPDDADGGALEEDD